jgi:uncharacterized protein DUF5597/glycosyl hydrolase family 42 (putative beta-galactosidase)
MRHFLRAVACFTAIGLAPMALAAGAGQQSMDPPGPHLVKSGSATQFIVRGKPFLILGGELHNSSASSLLYMEPIWPRLAEMNLNTVLATVSWELLEPEEGKFDFALVDGLVREARRHDLKLVFLWFGSWKNGVSSYVPAWVKTDLNRFPRMRPRSGQNLEVLTPLSDANRDADAKAFSSLMRHIREIDRAQQTVVMMQIENEVGLLGDSRDHSPQAEEAFKQTVPQELTGYLAAHKDTLIPEFSKYWEQAGAKTTGTWSEIFGDEADEAFMAWHMAQYVGHVAAEGKKSYAIPMYANAWLVQRENQKAGGYPSGGPVSKVMDVWRVAAPSIDFLAPDIYLPDFNAVCASYTRGGNPLFIPEAGGGATVGARAALAFGRYNAIGFCPFAIDSYRLDARNDSAEPPPALALKNAYAMLRQLGPKILEAQGRRTMAAVAQLKQDDPRQRLELVGYGIEINYRSSARAPGPSYGLVISTGNDEFLVAGQGLEVAFSARSPGPRIVRILSIEEGRFEGDRWIPGRRLNGDENAGGARLILPPGSPGIQRIRLYRHD